jgi:hypothetical protein
MNICSFEVHLLLLDVCPTIGVHFISDEEAQRPPPGKQAPGAEISLFPTIPNKKRTKGSEKSFSTALKLIIVFFSYDNREVREKGVVP